jgi:hypothetical protein
MFAARPRDPASVAHEMNGAEVEVALSRQAADHRGSF